LAETNVYATKEAGEAAAPEATRGGLYYTPRVDIYETADEVVLQCDLPGVKPQDVDVRFEKGELSLYGKVQPRRAPGAYLEEEYGVGDFYRSFSIAPEIDADKITAEYHDGVLTVHLPKQERVKPKRIAIKAS
jgi:HSP20 family molecular chaperone IbpA